jgi:3-deoxy-D-manno-octulosonic-acid transferase
LLTARIIAPHEMNRNLSLQKKTKGTLYSNAKEENIRDSRVLIIDNIGNLSKIYKYGTLAYIGGGFGRGIHNLLEATTFGLPVIFGPKYDKFNEAKELIKLDAGISVASYSELVFAIEKFIDFKNSISIDYVKTNSGATKKILSVL